MRSLQRISTALVSLLVAVIVAAPSLAFADHHRHGKKHKQACYRQVEYRDRVQDWDDDDDDRGCRRVRYCDPYRPVVSFGVQFGRPIYVERRVCPAPVVYVPQPVYISAPVPYYYDPGCDRRFSTFELYFEHASRNHSAAVQIRN